MTRLTLPKSSNPFSETGPSFKHPSRIWAIGGGKGGVGKSLITSSLAIALALKNYRVVCVDLDLGGANLHTCLGTPIPKRTLSDYLTKQVSSLEDLITPTPVKNLYMISGAQDEVSIANLKHMQKHKLLRGLSRIDMDFILLDLGAGTTFNTLDFFIMADKGILSVLPEPTSIENTYRFIKSVFHRKLKLTEELLDIQPLIQQIMNSKISPSQISPAEMIKKISQMNPEKGILLRKEVQKLSPKLIMNQVRNQQDVDMGFSIKTICKRYFDIGLDYIGYLDYDPMVWQSVKKRRPLMLEFPQSKLIVSFDKMIQRLLE